MFKFRPLLRFLIGLTLCVTIWQILIQETFMISREVDISYQYQTQPQYKQQQQQSFSFPSPASNLYNNYNITRHGLVNVSHLSRELIGQNEDIRVTTPTNITNKFIDSHLPNRNYNLSLVTSPYSVVNYEDLPKDDIRNLIDLHNFEFKINQKSCRVASLNFRTEINNSYSKENTDPGSPLLLILVHSAPENYQKRLLVRETWGSIADTVTNNVRLLFLLAAVNTTKDQDRLEQENRMYSDIVQGSFIDAYRNMTYKHVMALKWFTYYCPNVKYILKTDDDVFVNTPNLVDYLINDADRINLLFCLKLVGFPVKRDQSKWSVSTNEYTGMHYPPHCPGYSILYSQDVAFRLYLEAQKTRYFWIDDIHVTGTLAQQANITITSSKPFLLYSVTYENILAGNTHINTTKFIFAWPKINEEQIRKLWKLVENLR